MRLHIADGAAGQVRAQAELVPALTLVVPLEPVGIHAFTGGMVRGEVEVIEREQLAGDVALLIDLKAHGAERVVQVIAHLRDGVQAARERTDAGHGDVKVGRDLGSLHLQLRAALVDQLSQLRLRVVDGLAHLGADGRVELRQLLEQLRQRTLLAEQDSFDLLQLGLTLDRRDALSALLEQMVEFLFHIGPPFNRMIFGIKKCHSSQL